MLRVDHRGGDAVPAGRPVSERRAVVLVADRRVELTGLAAALVALVATSSLSPRTVALLCQIVSHEASVAAIDYGTLEVDLAGPRARLFRRDRLAHRPLGLPQEDSDVA